MAYGRALTLSEKESLKCERNKGQEKIKLLGDRDKLKIFFAEVFLLDGDWDFLDNFGGYYRLKTCSAVVSLYSTTKTLHIQGPMSQDIKSRLAMPRNHLLVNYPTKKTNIRSK